MKIAMLWRRERFADLFADAAMRLLAAAVKTEHAVSWRHRPPLWPGDADWICSDHLDAVYWSRAAAAVRERVRRHYGNHRRPLRAAAQRLYAAAATTAAGERAAARWLTIEPTPSLAPDVLFRGGGRRIRMIDLGRGRVWTVAKRGCGARDISAELAFRRHLPAGFPAPALGDVIDGGLGFWEALVPGRSLDQLDGRRAAAIRADAERHLGELARAGRRTVDAAPYVRGLAARVDFELGSDLAGPVIAAVVDAVFDAIIARLERLGVSSVTIAPSHGDLSGDNIVAGDGDGGFAITDWETAGERHEGFTWIEAQVAGVRRAGFGARLAALVSRPPSTPARACARRLIGDDAPVDDRRWRDAAALCYLAERLVLDAATALSGHLHRVGHELALTASEAELALQAMGEPAARRPGATA